MDDYENAARLSVISSRIGFAIWQLQELEGVAATYLVLRTKLTKGMRMEEANAFVEDAKKEVFGTTLRELNKAGLFEPQLQARFSALLDERNWLVHRSRASSRSAVYSDDPFRLLVQRVDGIASEALALLREIHQLTWAFLKEQGISEEKIREYATKTVAQWKASVGDGV